MLVAIHAYEQIFEGLHGIEDFYVTEVENEDEAAIIAEEMSYNVINDYDDVFSQLEEEAAESESDLDNLIQEDIDYEIFPIIKETTESLELLNSKFWEDKDSFIEEYC